MIDLESKESIKAQTNKEYVESWLKRASWDYEHEGGLDGDNRMDLYKSDIYYTRKKFKTIAEIKGFEKPYRFSRKDLHWIVEDEDFFVLLGKLVLTDKNGRTHTSCDLSWLVYQPWYRNEAHENWFTKWAGHDSTIRKYNEEVGKVKVPRIFKKYFSFEDKLIR